MMKTVVFGMTRILLIGSSDENSEEELERLLGCNVRPLSHGLEFSPDNVRVDSRQLPECCEPTV